MFYYRNSDYILRRIHGKNLMIDKTDNYKNNKCKIIEVNDVVSAVWNITKEKKTLAEILDDVSKIFLGEVKYEQLFTDIEKCLEVLVEVGLLKRGGQDDGVFE